MNMFSKSIAIETLRDSLDAVQYTIPQLPNNGNMKTIVIETQTQWDRLSELLTVELNQGERNIEIIVKGKNMVMPVNLAPISNLDYPDANIRIIGTKARMTSEGFVFSQKDENAVKDCAFWSVPYMEFNLNDIVVDGKGNEIPLRDETMQIEENILPAQEIGDDVWRMRINLPDMTEDICKDFYMLLTRDWTSARHKVVMVKEGWLFFHLDSDDLHSERNPNVDWMRYKVRPRYTLINCPISTGLHYLDGRLYVPKQYKKIWVQRGGILIHLVNCHLNTFEIIGFKLHGLSKCPIKVKQCTFCNGLFVHHNEFKQLSSLAFKAVACENVVFCDNMVAWTRLNAIDCNGKNITICRNRINNIGWMLNTRAITGSGDKLHICDNVIDNFNYVAIACGSRAPTRDSVLLNYIIERNSIRLTIAFSDNYENNTLADGGGIYIGPSCTQGIIRHNVIIGMNGIHGNRGIFLDDGAKNLALYGNLIMDTKNSYDIDLRYYSAFEKDIPDHNTRNSIFNNIMTGGYRFQDAGIESQCVGGENLIIGIGKRQKFVVELMNYVEDIKIEGKMKKEKLFLPKKYKDLLAVLAFSDFVKKYIIYDKNECVIK